MTKKIEPIVCCPNCGTVYERKVSKGRPTHGLYNSPTHRTWVSMKSRCDHVKSKGYERYGGRGISYDPRWVKFENFFADMGLRPAGSTLDRIDGTKGYSKENCRWATSAEQAKNRSSTTFVEYEGVTYMVGELADMLGIKRTTLYARIKYGRPLFSPVRIWKAKIHVES